MKHRKIESATRNVTYYIPIDQLNAADHVHLDMHDPNSDGYGGRSMGFELSDGTIDMVKGPWHGTNQMEQTGLNLSELHMTRVTLQEAILTDEAKYNRIERGEIIYEEKEMVLGAFYRGYRIAQQLANLRNEPIFFSEKSAGGGSSGCIYPKSTPHPLSQRKEDNKHERIA